MTQEELLEKIKKRNEQEEEENKIFATEEDEEGNVTTTINVDKLTPEQKLLLKLNYATEEKTDYGKASELADNEYQKYQGYSRRDLTDLYKTYNENSIKALEQNNIVDYYKDELIKTKLRKDLGEKTPATFAYDLASNIGQGFADFGSGLADKVVQAGISLETSLNPEFTYSGGDKYIAQGYARKAEEENARRFKEYQKNTEVGQATSAINASSENLALRQELGNYNLPEKIALIAGRTVPNTLVSAMIGKGVGAIAGNTAGLQAGLVSMGLSAAGNTTTQRLNQGYSWNKSVESGLADGLVEYVSEVVGGEALGKLVFGTRAMVTPMGKLVNKVFGKVKNKWLKAGAGILSDVAAEAVEEMFSEAVTPLLDQAILGEEITDWEEYGENIFMAGFQSILPTLILGGANRVQVANSIKVQMEEMTLAIEANPYISEEQKEKLRAGIVQAYDNASHFLSDEASEEQYNQIVADVYKALQEAQGKYESARDLSELMNASMAMQRESQRPQTTQPAAIQSLEQNRQAGETVNRLNTARQNTQNVIDSQTVKTNLEKQLASTPTEANRQTELNIKEGDSYTVNYEGEPVTIEVRAIRPDEETGEVMALVQTSINGAEPVVMPLTQLENRINELQQGTSQTTPATQFDNLKTRIKGNVETANGIERINVENTQDMYDYTVETERNKDRNREVTPDELYNSPVAFTVYGDNGHTTTTIYKNMNDWQKDMKVTYGGLNQVVGKGKDKMRYTVQSVSGLGEYYAKRNSLYKGGWEWYDANGYKLYGDFRKHRSKVAKNSEPTELAESKDVKVTEIPKTKRKFLENFEHVGYINVNGSKVENIYDLADIAQVFRDPTVETLRLLFMQGNKVVSQSAFTSLLPDGVYIDTKTLRAEIQQKMKTTKADSFYMLHNHPSGNADVSKEDIKLTTELENLFYFKGHIIIDHNEFSYIDRQGDYTEHLQLKNETKNNIEKNISQDGWFSIRLNRPEDIASAAFEVNHNPNYSCLFLLSTKNTVQMLQELPNNFFKKTGLELNKYIEKLARENGAAKVAITTQNQKLFYELLTKGVRVLDVIYVTQDAEGNLKTFNSAASSDLISSRSFFANVEATKLEEVEQKQKKKSKPVSVYKLQSKKTAEKKTVLNEEIDNNLKEEILSYIEEEGLIDEELKRIYFEELEKNGVVEEGQDWADYVTDEQEELATAIAYDKFIKSKEGKTFIKEYKQNDTTLAEAKTQELKFATDMETSKNSITERMIRRVEANPDLREEHEIVSTTEIRDYINNKILKGKLGVGQYRHNALGVFNPLSNWVRIGQISNVDTLMHETGHYIDDEVLKEIYKTNIQMKTELRNLCKMAFEGLYAGKLKKQLQEGFAEATRYFFVAPKELAKIAPVTASIIAQEFDKTPLLKETYPKIQKMFHDYINMTAQERVHSKVVTGTPNNRPSIDSKPTQALRWIIRKMFNKNEALTKYDKEIQKSWEKEYGKNVSIPTTLKLFDNMRRSNSSGESFIQQLNNGVYDPLTNKRITKGLARILDPLKEEAEKNHKQAKMSYDEYLNKRINDVIDLGLAERTIELYDRSQKERKIYETGIRLEDAANIIKQFKGDKAIHQVLEDIREVGRNLIDYAAQKGVLKPETAKKIKKANVWYMPLNRILEDYGSFGSSKNQGATGRAYHTLKGSDRDIQNPMESLLGNWARVLQVIDNNFVLQQMVKVGDEVKNYGDFFTKVAPLQKYQGQVSLEVFKDFLENNLSPWEFNNLDLEETYNLFVPELASPQKMTISYLENGKRKYIKFANNDYGRPLYEALTNLNAKQANQLLNTISLFNQGIRYGATTMNPFFAIGNTFSDQFQAFLYSDGLIFPVINIVFDMVRLAKARTLNYQTGNKSPDEIAKLYRMYQESGASLSGKYKLAEKEVRKSASEVWGVSNKALFGTDSKLNQVKDIGSKAKNILSWLPEFSEEMTRFGEFVRVYNKLVKDGMSETQAKLEAGVKAREITQDFSIQGDWMQYVNKVIPFSAAKMGGLYRFAQEAKKNPGRLSMRMGILVGLAILLAEMRHGDDEAEDYYEELNNRKKFDNFVWPYGGSEPYIMKKPQGAPRYFINLIESVYDLATGHIPEGEEEKRFIDWFTLTMSDMLPISDSTEMIPSFAQAFIENRLNQDFYYGSKIVPQELEKLDPRHQYNEYTSEFSKALGNLFNLSPLKIDNLIEGTFAGMGSAALDLGDLIYDRVTGNETRTPSQSYAKSRIRGDVYRSSESVNIVYDKIDEYEREEAEGRLTPEQQEDYERLKTAKTTFNKISKQMKAIRQDTTMKTEQKEEELSKLYELRTDTARYYLGKDLINESSKDKIETYKYYPSSTTYKYNVGNKTVELSFESEKIQEEYAKMLKTQYEKELEKLKRKSTYRKATEEEKAEQEKKLLSNTRQKVNEEMKKKVYREQKGG